MEQTVDEFVADMSRQAEVFGQDNRPAFEECVEVIQRDQRQHFDDKQDSLGVAWPPHAPATIVRHGVHPLLELTGRMKDAATGRGTGNLTWIGATVLHFGVYGGYVPYAAFQQDGTSRIPPREYLYFSEDAAQECADIVGNFAYASLG